MDGSQIDNVEVVCGLAKRSKPLGQGCSKAD